MAGTAQQQILCIDQAAPSSAGAAAVTSSSVGNAAEWQAAAFDAVFATVTDATVASFTHTGALAQIKLALKPGGAYTHTETSARSADDAKLEIMLAGLEPGAEAAIEGGFTVTCVSPAAAGTTALPGKASVAASSSDAAAAAWGVTMVTGDAVDETELLAGDDAADAVKAPSDCSTKPRACANCSCGRAEAEAKAVQLSEEELQSFTSSCGNCFKGDAFRCATCPHRGKPAFKPGLEGVMLDTGADDLGGPIAFA